MAFDLKLDDELGSPKNPLPELVGELGGVKEYLFIPCQRGGGAKSKEAILCAFSCVCPGALGSTMSELPWSVICGSCCKNE